MDKRMLKQIRRMWNFIVINGVLANDNDIARLYYDWAEGLNTIRGRRIDEKNKILFLEV